MTYFNGMYHVLKIWNNIPAVLKALLWIFERHIEVFPELKRGGRKVCDLDKDNQSCYCWLANETKNNLGLLEETINADMLCLNISKSGLILIKHTHIRLTIN